MKTLEDCHRLRGDTEQTDVGSRNGLVQANMRLVYRVARQYVNRGLTFEDLVGEGNLGLIRAAEGYDPTLGTRFSTYANYWIREAILSALANTASTIRLPVNVTKMLGRWRRTEKALYQVHGHPPTFEEVASAMGLDRAKRRLMAQVQRVACIPMDESESEDGRSRSLLMLVGGGRPEDSLAAEEEQEWVSRGLERLGVKERTIIVLRYGLKGEPPMTLGQIGDRLGISAATVQRLMSRAMRALGGREEPFVVEHGPAYQCRVG